MEIFSAFVQLRVQCYFCQAMGVMSIGAELNEAMLCRVNDSSSLDR